jgi:hypothetical protein
MRRRCGKVPIACFRGILGSLWSLFCFYLYFINKPERNMSKSKFVGIVTMVVLALGILLVGDAVAGKEGTEGVTGSWYSASKVVAFGQDYIYGTEEGFSVWVGEAGKEMLLGNPRMAILGFPISRYGRFKKKARSNFEPGPLKGF